MQLKKLSAKWHPLRLSLNVLKKIQSGAVITWSNIIIILQTALQWLRQDINQEFELTKDTPYLAFMEELWGVYCEEFGENLLLYKYVIALQNFYKFLKINIKISMEIRSQ